MKLISEGTNYLFGSKIWCEQIAFSQQINATKHLFGYKNVMAIWNSRFFRRHRFVHESMIKFKQNEQPQAQMWYSYFFIRSALCFVCLTRHRGLLCKKVSRSFAWIMRLITALGTPSSEGSALTGNAGSTSMMVSRHHWMMP
jgi:hypothetical protein